MSPEVEKFALKLTMYLFLVVAWGTALHLLHRNQFDLAGLAILLGTVAALFLFLPNLQALRAGHLLEARTHQAGELVTELKTMAELLGAELMTANAASRIRNGKAVRHRQRAVDQIETVLARLGVDKTVYAEAKRIYLETVAADLLDVLRFLQNRILQSAIDKLGAEREMRFKGAVNPHDPAYQDFVQRWKAVNRLRDELNQSILAEKTAQPKASGALAKHAELVAAAKLVEAETREALEKIVRGVRTRIEKLYSEGRISEEDAAFIERLNQIDQHEASWRGVYGRPDAA